LLGGRDGKRFLPATNKFLKRKTLSLLTQKKVDRALGAKNLEKLPQTQHLKLHKNGPKNPLKTHTFPVMQCHSIIKMLFQAVFWHQHHSTVP
jgi:hypothetical protein